MVDHRSMKTPVLIAIPFVFSLSLAACKGDDKPLEPAVFGKAVAAPGPLGKLKIGMPVDEAKKVAGSYIPSGKRDYQSYPSGYSGMKYAVGLDDEKTKVNQIRIIIPESAKATLDKAWGASLESKCHDDPCWYWFDASTGVRAKAEKEFRKGYIGVDFYNYSPIDKLFAPKPATFAFETTPLLGATIDDVKKAYGAQYHEDAGSSSTVRYLELPPTKYESYWTRVNLHDENGKVTELAMSIETPDEIATAHDELYGEIEKQWGKPVETKDIMGGTVRTWFDPAAGRRVVLEPSVITSQLSFKAMPYMPLVKFLGEGADKLGWETTPLLGATLADLAKAYPEYAKLEGTDMTFWAPRVEHPDSILVQFTVDEASGKVTEYRYGLKHDADAAKRDEIKAALEKKYGPGQPGVDSLNRPMLVLHAAAPRVVAKDEPIMKEWEIEVSP
jgi:hypothetical protein